MTSMDPALHELYEGGDPEEEVAAVIRLRRAGTAPAGVRVVAQFGEIITCRLRRADIPRVRADANVESMKGPRLFTPDYELDAPGFADFGEEARETDERRPVGARADGRGVVVGVIDWGVDFAHPDFVNDDGTTRLLAVWDQRARPEAAAPSPYGYGEVFDPAAINRALKSRDPYAALGYHPADSDADRTGTHGTHVLGIAAGNGRGGGPEGVAPAADLVFVHLAMWGKGEQDRIGDSVTIVEALDFVARTAGARPWVVNMSLGRHAGPHDGTTLVEQALDAAVTAAPGRAVVQSAGNYFDRRAHASGQLRPGESRTLGWKTDVADTTPNELEVWYPGQDHISVEVRAPDGFTSPRVELGQRDSMRVGGREVCKIYNRAEDPNNLHNHIDIFLYPGGPAGEWEVTLYGEDVVDGRFHAWIERDAACYHCQSHFDPRDAVTSTTTGTLCNGFRNVAVGAYNAHAPEFEMGPFSSGGPTRDGRIKPDLVAPGVYILAARSAPRHRHPEDSLYTRKSGTSMAAPHVTGTVALMFEVAARPLRIRDTRKLLLTSTRSIPASAELVVRVGSGVLDTARAVELTRRFFEEGARPHARVAETSTADAEGFAARAPAFIGAAAAEALRGLSELPHGHARCEFVRPGDMIASSPFLQEATESDDTPGAEIMNDERERRTGCGCGRAVEAVEDNDFARDDAEAAGRRNFVLISGGPGPFDNRDVEHDSSWSNYVDPPLLKSPVVSGKLSKQFWEKDEDVLWLVYKPAYVSRWADDSASTHAARKAAVEAVKKKGFKSYVDLIEHRANDRGWSLKWLSKADDLWAALKSLKDPISRVWYWGHARNDLWLTVRHNPSTGSAMMPSADEVIEVSDIDPCLRGKFQAGDPKRVHRFVGCNTKAFAQAWASTYDVWTEGVEDKVNFVTLPTTGGEPCLVGSATVHYFKPCGTEATSGAPASPYKACTASSTGSGGSSTGRRTSGEGLGLETEDEQALEYEYANAAVESFQDFAADGYSGDDSQGESQEPAYEAAAWDYGSSFSPSFTSYAPSLVELADAAVTDGETVPPGRVLHEMLAPSGHAATLNPLGTGRALSPAVIFDAFTRAGSRGLRQHFESVFEVIGVPGRTFAEQLRPGDLLLRRGEGGLAHLAVIAAPGLWHLEQLGAAGLRPEGTRAGLYAHVIEGGAFPHASADGFARLVFERRGLVPHGQMVLRLRHAPASAGWESAESVSDSALWSEAVNRHSPEYTRWVQSSLNQVDNAGLAVDGINGPKTRAAVRNFQRKHGLVVDGIVGPQTEAALMAAGAPPPPGSDEPPSPGPPGPVNGGPAFPPSAVIDERIDVSAQFALQRMSRGDESARSDAVGMLTAVKQGQLQGIFGDDLRRAAELAARRGTVRWELVPKGEDAALVLEPGDTTGAVPPTIIFRGGNPPQSQGVRDQPQRLDPALRKAWHSFLLLKQGGLTPCTGPATGGGLSTFADSTETVFTPGLFLANVMPPLCELPGGGGEPIPPFRVPPCAIPPKSKEDPSALSVSPVGSSDYSSPTKLTTSTGRSLTVRGTVFFPAKTGGSKEFNDAVGKRAPIVFIAHGNHGTVFDPADRSKEFCAGDPRAPAGALPIPNHKGYAYLQEQLARMGIIAVSVDCNETNCNAIREDLPGAVKLALSQRNITERAELIAASIKHFQGLDTSGDKTFGGHIDFAQVGLLGHSRGGEAVLLVPELHGTRAASGITIRGVISLAPTDVFTTSGAPKGFAFMAILPAGDGDVASNDGAHFYDKAVPSPFKTQLYIENTNHNFFNTQWVNDEHTGPPVLADTEHRKLLSVYGCAFFRTRLLGHKLEAILTGREIPLGAQTDKVQLSAEVSGALTVDDHEDSNPNENTLSQKLVKTGFAVAQEIPFTRATTAIPAGPGLTKPNRSFFGNTTGLLLRGSATTNQFTSPLSAPTDLTGREVWIRAAEVYEDPPPPGPTGFMVGLVDVNNTTVFIDSDQAGGVPRPYRRRDAATAQFDDKSRFGQDLSKTMPKTFRFPAKCFTTGSKLDIKKVKAVLIHLNRSDNRNLAFDQLQIVKA